MKAHGGQVEIQSEPGRGTEVRLRFPAGSFARATSAPGPELAPEPSGEALRILVVDDDPIIAESLPAMLEFLGHWAQAATRGQEALELLDGGLQVDVVVLDHNMPGLSGAETLVGLRERRPDLPVILSTGYLEASVEALADSLPRVWLLNKPFTLATMREKLNRVRTALG
jgi:CheY-like chemotaxis protein